MKLTVGGSNQLVTMWPWLEPLLLSARRGMPSTDTWSLADVYTAIAANEAVVLVFTEDDAAVGMAIVKQVLDEHERPVLWVWVAAADGGTFANAVPLVREYAASRGLKALRFNSSRTGWARHARVISALYEIEV